MSSSDSEENLRRRLPRKKINISEESSDESESTGGNKPTLRRENRRVDTSESEEESNSRKYATKKTSSDKRRTRSSSEKSEESSDEDNRKKGSKREEKPKCRTKEEKERFRQRAQRFTDNYTPSTEEEETSHDSESEEEVRKSTRNITSEEESRSDEDSDPDYRKPAKHKQSDSEDSTYEKKTKTLKKVERLSEDDSSESNESIKKNQRKQRINLSEEDSDDSIRNKTLTKNKPRRKSTSENESESSDDEAGRNKKHPKKENVKQKLRKGNSSDDESDDKRKTGRGRIQKRREIRESSSDEEVVQQSSSEDESDSRRKKKYGKEKINVGKKTRESVSDSDSEASTRKVQRGRRDEEKSKRLVEKNILVMGQTGVGKSTWLNGIANYLLFGSFKEAERNGPVSCAHTSFTIITSDYTEIKIGGDKSYDSCTQDCKTYSIEHDGMKINIIDTPGVGDTRGVDQDRKNLQMILDHIKHMDYLHGICILLKPNEARLTILFRFCLQELLKQLHKNAVDNIIFCLTNARATLFKPGETIMVLEQFMKEVAPSFRLDNNKIYCFDNESYRYFMTHKRKDVKYVRSEIESYKNSWNQSISQTEKMLEYIKGLRPHNVDDTISLNDARMAILCIIKPLAEITHTIEANISSINDFTAKLKDLKQRGKALGSSKGVKVYVLKAIKLGHPRTVCCSQTCAKRHKVRNSSQTVLEYSKICCDPCKLVRIPQEKEGNEKLRGCKALKKGICKVCGCDWKFHMHILYEQVREEQYRQLPTVDGSEKEKYEKSMKMLKEDVEELKAQERQIVSTSAKFGHFLKVNALAPYNDSMVSYLSMLIHQEEQKSRSDVLEKLKTSKSEYENELKFLDKTMKGETEKVCSPDEIYELIEDLYRMENIGKSLKATMKIARRAEEREARLQYEEVTIKTHALSSD